MNLSSSLLRQLWILLSCGICVLFSCVTFASLSEAGESPQPVEGAPLLAQPTRQVQDMLEVQIALARLGISPGVLDGKDGPQTHKAVSVFQKNYGLEPTGIVDMETRKILHIWEPIYTNYVVTPDDIQSLCKIPATWLGKSQVKRLNYESILELVAEHSYASENLITRMNPDTDWTRVEAGAILRLPNVWQPLLAARPEKILIQLGEKSLSLLDKNGKIIFYCPCSIAEKDEKAPRGDWHIAHISKEPHYRFIPENFPESPEAQTLGRELLLPPGPNNPVGIVWMGLSKKGYGIHGTPQPEKIGNTFSHGCIRLANWNAAAVASYIREGIDVQVVD